MAKHRTLLSILLAALLMVAMSSAASHADEPSSQTPRLPEIAVIVNGELAEDLDREEIAQIFLKKRRFWRNGTPILPVNRNSGAPGRKHFDQAIFGRQRRGLLVYWNRAYFRGVLPPATLASDEAILRFVASEPRAIAYVDAASVRDSIRGSVRVVLHLPRSRD